MKTERKRETEHRSGVPNIESRLDRLRSVDEQSLQRREVPSGQHQQADLGHIWRHAGINARDRARRRRSFGRHGTGCGRRLGHAATDGGDRPPYRRPFHRSPSTSADPASPPDRRFGLSQSCCRFQPQPASKRDDTRSRIHQRLARTRDQIAKGSLELYEFAQSTRAIVAGPCDSPPCSK